MSKAVAKNTVDVGRKIEYLMATGNLVSNTGLDLQQASGFTIVADKLNFYRYLSHFRCIHRCVRVCESNQCESCTTVSFRTSEIHMCVTVSSVPLVAQMGAIVISQAGSDRNARKG